MTRVLFFWQVPERLQNYLKDKLMYEDNIELIFPENTDEDYLNGLAKDAQILVGWRPSMDLLRAAKDATLFINPGAGIRRLLDKFRKINKKRNQPLVLVNGHGNSYFTAQHAVALLLSTTNHIVPHHTWMSQGLWRRGDSYAKSDPIRNKTVGLLGYGSINQKVHQFLKGFDVEFAALKSAWNEHPEDLATYSPDKLEQFLRVTDILIVALPLTRFTENMIGEQELEWLGSSSYIINIARGGIIDEEALFKALEEKTIAGAGLDVWYEYAPEPDELNRKYPYTKPFHELDNVVMSPHRGASPMDDLGRWDEVVENIIRVHHDENEFLNVVNLESEY